MNAYENECLTWLSNSCLRFVDDINLLLSQQNSSQSSLDDSLDLFDGSESQSLQDQLLHRPQRGKILNPLHCAYMLGRKKLIEQCTICWNGHIHVWQRNSNV